MITKYTHAAKLGIEKYNIITKTYSQVTKT